MSVMVTFKLIVAPTFWDTPRTWPEGCRPVVFSTDLIMRNAGTLQVPSASAAEVEALLRRHPEILAVSRVLQPLPFPVMRRAA